MCVEYGNIFNLSFPYCWMSGVQIFRWKVLYCSDYGWLRLVGSLKLQVSFAEYRLFCKALLQKRPIILRSLLIVATPHDTFQRKLDTPDI